MDAPIAVVVHQITGADQFHPDDTVAWAAIKVSPLKKLRLLYRVWGYFGIYATQPAMTEMAQLLAQMQAAQAVLADQSRRIEAAMNAQDDRLATLESAAGQRIRWSQAAVADLSDTLSLAGETITG